MNRNQLNFVCIYDDALQILTHIFICAYRSLYRIDILKKPDSDLKDIFCVTYSYYGHHIM